MTAAHIRAHILVAISGIALTACAHTPVREIETHEVAVTHVERALTEQQVRDNTPPAPLGARPATLAAMADALAAKLCEYVLWGQRADAMNQHAAGMTPAARVAEPICQRP